MSAVRAYPLYEPTASLAANDHTHASERPSRSALHCNRFTGSIADIPRGNIREKVLGTRSVTMSYDLRNRLSAANDTGETGNRTVSYDTRGNVTWLGGQNFTYNAMNRPTSMGGDVDAVHRYDGHGRRIRTVTYKDEGGYIIRYNVFGATGDLIFNVQIDQSPTDENYVTTMVKMDGQTIASVKSEGRQWNYTDTVTYLHNDHLGSAGSGTKADGTIAWREEYSPFGMTLINDAANDNQAGFTGHIKDSDTGLNYMQARYYDPVIGRFLSVDPVTFVDSVHPASFNRYAYGLNDPVNLTDPTGTCVDGITCPDPSPITSSTTTINTTTNPSGSQTDTRATTHTSSDFSYTRIEHQGSVERLPQKSLGGVPATVPPAMQEKLLNFSELEGETVQVTSGVRTPAQNAAVNGAKSSPHLSTNPEQAADIKIQGYSRSQTFNAAASSGQFNRINEYDPSAPNAQSGRAGVHVDLNTTRRQGRYVNWVYQGP